MIGRTIRRVTRQCGDKTRQDKTVRGQDKTRRCGNKTKQYRTVRGERPRGEMVFTQVFRERCTSALRSHEGCSAHRLNKIPAGDEM